MTYLLHLEKWLQYLAPGGGKSSLMNIISGLDYDYEGEVIFNGEKLTDKKAKQLSDFKKHIGFVFQNFNLINHMDVFDNVKFLYL